MERTWHEALICIKGQTVPEAKITRLNEKIATLRQEMRRLNALDQRRRPVADRRPEAFNAEQTELFRLIMTSREVTRLIMATAAASLFVPESLAPNTMPRFREGLGELQASYERILEQTFGVSEGVWPGTPFNLNLERESGDPERRMPEILQPILCGARSNPPADLKVMAAVMPDCRLITVPGTGRSMNLESPALYARYFGAWFGGLPGREVAI